MAKVSHIVLPVSDVLRSREWYVNKLGFTIERELEQAVGIKDQSGLTIFLLKTGDPLTGPKITLTIQVGDEKYSTNRRPASGESAEGDDELPEDIDEAI